MSSMVSLVSVWQLVCVITSAVLTWASWFHTKRKRVKRCPAGGLLVGSDGWSQAYIWMVELLLFPCVCVYVGCSRLLGYISRPTAQSCALSCGHRVWRVGWGRRPVTDGYRGAGCGRSLPRAPTPPEVRESRRGRHPPHQEGIWLRFRYIICPAFPPLLWPVPWFGSFGCRRHRSSRGELEAAAAAAAPSFPTGQRSRRTPC